MAAVSRLRRLLWFAFAAACVDGSNTAFLHPHRWRVSTCREIGGAPQASGRRSRRAAVMYGANNDGEDMQIDRDSNDATISKSRIQAKRKDEWIDGKQMMQILAQEKAEKESRKKEELFDRQLQKNLSFQRDELQQTAKMEVDRVNFVSRVSYTDANTLQINVPPPGMDANTVASGAFSALWFSAVAPATISMLSAGVAPALFMVPFWLAGGIVAKTAVYDPFVSSSLSVGKYLWTLETGGLKAKKEEGATESLKGASVELAMVVNNVQRYQLRLFTDGNGSVTFGKGLAPEELEYLAGVINDHCAMLRGSAST